MADAGAQALQLEIDDETAVSALLIRPARPRACFAMGEAAGTAAAPALWGNTSPRDIGAKKLQQALQAQDAFIERDQAVPAGL